MKKALLEVLEKTELMRDGKTKEVMDRAVQVAFDALPENAIIEMEDLAILAHKYQLRCLDEIINELESCGGLPF